MIFNVASMYLNAIRDNKMLSKMSELKVVLLKHLCYNVFENIIEGY